MKRRVPCFAGLAALLILAACGGRPTVVDAGKTVVLGDTVRVQPQTSWNREETGLLETWMVVGKDWDKVEFLQGGSDGDHLVSSSSYGYMSARARRGSSFPAFREGMTGLEIHDLYVASLSKIGVTGISTRDVRPWRVDGHPGFRFEFTHNGDDGRERAGFTVGFVLNGKLWLITYTSGSLTSYEVYRDRVEALIASVKLP